MQNTKIQHFYLPLPIWITVIGTLESSSSWSNALPRMSSNVIDIKASHFSPIGIHGKSEGIAQAITINLLTFDAGLRRPATHASLRLLLHVRVVVGNVTIGSQTQDFAQQHIQRLRIQNAIAVGGGDTPAAISDADIQMSIGPESNLAGVVAPVRHDGRIEEHFLGVHVHLEVSAEHKSCQPIDRSPRRTARRIAIAKLVQRPIQINVAIPILPEIGMEGATAQTAFDIGTDRLELQRPGHGGIVAFVVLHDVQRPVLVGDHHQLGAVGRYLDVSGILNLDDEVLLEVTSEIGIDGQLHMIGVCWSKEEGSCQKQCEDRHPNGNLLG